MAELPTSSADSMRPRFDARPPARIPLYRFLSPRYWAIWLGMGFVRLVNQLPIRWQMRLGRAIGDLAWRLSRRDRHVAEVNVALCLPELDELARHRLVRQHFQSLGCALFETGLVWWATDERLRRFVRIEGAEHLERALAAGRGAILLSAHFTTLEMGARSADLVHPVSIMYMTPRNALVAEMSRRGRGRHAVRAIASDNIRELIASLRANVPVWYAPDQRYTDKASAIVPFFGHPAATNVATSRLAKLSGAPVLPYFPARLRDDSGYIMKILPPPDGYPGDDPVEDAKHFHALIEAHVREWPEQYLWSYKRFKRPGAPDPYAR